MIWTIAFVTWVVMLLYAARSMRWADPAVVQGPPKSAKNRSLRLVWDADWCLDCGYSWAAHNPYSSGANPPDALIECPAYGTR